MPEPSRVELRVPSLHEPVSHYTHAVRFGQLLFVSGITGTDRDSRVVGPDDVAAQTRQAFQNIKAILDQAGATFADVLKVTVYLTDIEDRPKINPVRQEFFGEARPASTLVEISRLVFPEAKVEIEAVVGLPGAADPDAKG